MTVHVLAVAGPAGSGKSTLAGALAARTRLPLLDLDTLTNPLLDALGPPGGHWDDPAWRPVVRPARYACLLAAATEQVRAGSGAILVAPFSAELTGGDEWQRLLAAVAPAVPLVCWLDVPPGLRRQRMSHRGAARDLRLAADEGLEPSPSGPPQVDHLRLDAALPPAELVALLLQARPELGRGLTAGPAG